MIDKKALVSPLAKIGKNSKIWAFSHIREGVVVGDNCIIGSGVYIDKNVIIGANVKIQNQAQIFHGATIEDGVFIGPLVCLANDKYPRAVNVSGRLKTEKDWQVGKILIKKGASLGSGAIVLPGVVIGSYALVAAGAVVTRAVPDFALVVGNPARICCYVCKQGHKLNKNYCLACRKIFIIPDEKK